MGSYVTSWLWIRLFVTGATPQPCLRIAVCPNKAHNQPTLTWTVQSARLTWKRSCHDKTAGLQHRGWTCRPAAGWKPNPWTSSVIKRKKNTKQNGADKALCLHPNVNLLICEISGFSNVRVNNEICVMQQLLPGLNPILSGAALQSIHLMNNGKFNPRIVRSTC